MRLLTPLPSLLLPTFSISVNSTNYLLSCSNQKSNIPLNPQWFSLSLTLSIHQHDIYAQLAYLQSILHSEVRMFFKKLNLVASHACFNSFPLYIQQNPNSCQCHRPFLTLPLPLLGPHFHPASFNLYWSATYFPFTGSFTSPSLSPDVLHLLGSSIICWSQLKYYHLHEYFHHLPKLMILAAHSILNICIKLKIFYYYYLFDLLYYFFFIYWYTT